MRISFVITGVLEIDDNWGDPAQIQREIQRDFPDALGERAGQWHGLPLDTKMHATCTTMIQT